MDKVRCDGCGFLAARDRQTRELVEVESGMRKKWELPNILNSSFKKYEDFPLCLYDKVDLCITAKSYRIDDVLALVQQERECDCFTEWRPGFSPKEHAEMMNAAELRRQADEQRERDRAWQAAQQAAQQAWQASQEEKNREWQKEQMAAEHRFRVRMWLLGTAFVLLAYFLGISTPRR